MLLDSSDLIVTVVTFFGVVFGYFYLKEIYKTLLLFKRIEDIKKSSDKVQLNVQRKRNRKKISDLLKLSEQLFAGNLKNYGKRMIDHYRTHFEQAGLSPLRAPQISLASKVILAIAGFLLGWFSVNFISLFANQSAAIKLVIMIIFAFIGTRIFEALLQIRVKLRYKYLKQDIPNALDLLVICTNVGLSIDNSLEKVAQEIGNFNKELGKEFALTSIELNILPDRRKAYENLSRRVDLPLMKALTTTLIQSEEQGTSVSDTLKMLSSEFRKGVVLDAEAKAARLPAILAIPVVLFTLPSLILVILGPGIVRLLSSPGWN